MSNKKTESHKKEDVEMKDTDKKVEEEKKEEPYDPFFGKIYFYLHI
jgi:hypothetical protein